MASKIWFTSDWHLGHFNIITYSGRPFSSTEEMDAALVENHNKLVRPQDKVYNLGDVVINKKHLHKAKAFNGHKRLLRGNHDVYTTKMYLDAGFEEIAAYRVMAGMIFSHIPIHESSMGRFGMNVHGHMHEKKLDDVRYMNICVEHTDYAPLSLEQIVEEMRSRHGSEYLDAHKGSNF